MRTTKQEAPGERRYDSVTLRKVAALAARLQSRKQETVSEREMEAIGSEVGLEPAFIREALAQIEPEEAVARPKETGISAHWWKTFATCWWSVGWMLLPISMMLADGGGDMDHPIFFFISLAIYIVTGRLLSTAAKVARTDPPAELSRTALLRTLFLLQQQLEGQKQHRAFLSVDVVGSSEMKRGASELAVEYSFGQFGRWVEELVKGSGGEIHSAAGDGMMCVFPTDAGAVRAARRLQEGLPRFNAEQNHLPAPFQIRCGVSSGSVPYESGMSLGQLHSPVVDRAAALQKHAAPGDILVGGEVAAEALIELGETKPLPEPVAGQPAFSWRGAHRELPPGGP